jgi:tetratricopeptide (TPR) repeat protein
LPERIPSPLDLALTYLRSAAAWSKGRLAQALGLADESSISHYERGARLLTREKLESLVAPMGHPSEAVDVLLFAHQLIFPEPRKAEPASPVALSPEEHRTVDRAAMAAGWTAGQIAAEAVRGELIRTRKQEKADAARQEAERLFQGLMAATGAERGALVEAFPDYWNWALAVRVCAESVRRAAHRAEEALELADLASAITERVPGEESWRSRLKGFAWAHVANARRVANDLAGADQAFARAWDLWRAGAGSAPELLAEWQLFSLEASLRRDQLRFSAALELLDRARAASGENQVATARLLLQKGNVLEQMGDSERALAALREAAPFVEATGDPRLAFGLRFDTANNLYLLSRYADAAELMPKVRELAVQQANELDLIRIVWLESRVAAGEGRAEEAVDGLEQVRGYFTARELAYDAALSSLDLAVVWLKAKRTVEVKELAVAMGWIFKTEGIDREALAALTLFCDAARQESATVGLARQVAAEIEKVRRSAPPAGRGRGRG